MIGLENPPGAIEAELASMLQGLKARSLSLSLSLPPFQAFLPLVATEGCAEGAMSKLLLLRSGLKRTRNRLLPSSRLRTTAVLQCRHRFEKTPVTVRTLKLGRLRMDPAMLPEQ